MKQFLKNQSPWLVTLAVLFAASEIRAQVLTNGAGAPVGAPATPTSTLPGNPRILVVSNSDLVTNAITEPITNRLYPPSTNADNAGNLTSPRWFDPKAPPHTNYGQSTNDVTIVTTNGIPATNAALWYRVNPNK